MVNDGIVLPALNILYEDIYMYIEYSPTITTKDPVTHDKCNFGDGDYLPLTTNRQNRAILAHYVQIWRCEAYLASLTWQLIPHQFFQPSLTISQCKADKVSS